MNHLGASTILTRQENAWDSPDDCVGIAASLPQDDLHDEC